MKNLTQLLFTLFCLCLPAMLQAQDKDDSKYLAGAVPEVDGKVVFTKEFSIPGMSQDEIYERLLGWMDARLKENENTSRVVFSDKEKGQIVGIGDEWIVFSSTALSLDRTKILYQLTVTCQPEKSVLEVEKIRFNYREGKEKYTAEEWIVDKYALNKAKTKLVRRSIERHHCQSSGRRKEGRKERGESCRQFRSDGNHPEETSYRGTCPGC